MESELKKETEQERRKRLDDSFNELKNDLRQKIESEKNRSKMIVLELIDDIIEEYIDFVKNDSCNIFETQRIFDTKYDANGNQILLKPFHSIDAPILFDMFENAFTERHIRLGITKEWYASPKTAKATYVKVTFTFPALKNML